MSAWDAIGDVTRRVVQGEVPIEQVSLDARALPKGVRSLLVSELRRELGEEWGVVDRGGAFIYVGPR